MNKQWKDFLIFLKISSVLSIFILLFACNNKQEFTPTYLKMGKNLPFTEADSMWINIKTLNQLKSKIFAKKSYTYARSGTSNPDSLIALNIVMLGYDKNGVQDSKLVADSAFINNKKNLIYAYGNVRLNSEKGNLKCEKIFWDRNPLTEKIKANKKVFLNSPKGKLTTNLLIYDKVKDLIFCPSNVKLERNNHTSYGVGLKTNYDFTYVHMDSVKAEGVIDEKNVNF